MSLNCKKAFSRSFVVACVGALFGATGASAAVYTWAGAGTAASWGATGNFTPTPVFNNQSDLEFPTSAVTQVNTLLGAARTIRSMSFGSDLDSAFTISYRNFISGGAAVNLTMDADAVAGNASINVTSGASGPITIGTNIVETTGTMVLADNLVVDHNGSGLLLFNRNISGTGFGVTKTGTGTMQTANSNPFTGPLAVNGGRWIVSQGVFDVAFDGADLDNSSGVTLGGGTLEVVGTSTSTVAKSFDVTITVTAPSTLSYNNLSSTSRNVTYRTNALALNADLTIENISANPTTLVNGINLSRSIAGTGDLIISTANNVTSSASNASLQRVSLSGDSAGWSGDLRIARGTAVIAAASGTTPTGTGDIIIGTTGDSFGAGLGFNQVAGVDVSLANDVVVRSGGFRIIRNNGEFSTNITFTGAVALEGDLTVDHIVATGRTIAFNGNISGPGALTITRSGGGATAAGSRVRLGGVNTYLGNTTVTNEAGLILDGSITSNVSIAAGAMFGGVGSTTGNLTMAAGSFFIFSPTATIDVDGTVTLDPTFGVDDLVTQNGTLIDWTTVSTGTYTLIGSTTSTFGYVQNFGLANAATVGDKLAYFQNGSLQLVVTPIPEPTTLSVFVALGSLVTLRRRRD